MFDIGVLSMLGNTHFAYEFTEEEGSIIFVFHQGNNVARYTTGGMLIENIGFADAMLKKFAEVVRLNSKRVEEYVNEGDCDIYG